MKDKNITDFQQLNRLLSLQEVSVWHLRLPEVSPPPQTEGQEEKTKDLRSLSTESVTLSDSPRQQTKHICVVFLFLHGKNSKS